MFFIKFTTFIRFQSLIHPLWPSAGEQDSHQKLLSSHKYSKLLLSFLLVFLWIFLLSQFSSLLITFSLYCYSLRRNVRYLIVERLDKHLERKCEKEGKYFTFVQLCRELSEHWAEFVVKISDESFSFFARSLSRGKLRISFSRSFLEQLFGISQRDCAIVDFSFSHFLNEISGAQDVRFVPSKGNSLYVKVILERQPTMFWWLEWKTRNFSRKLLGKSVKLTFYTRHKSSYIFHRSHQQMTWARTSMG